MCFGPYPRTMPRKTRANRIPSTPSVSPSTSQLFKNDRCHEAFEKLNSMRKIWTECSVILDEVNLAIKANLESRGWLSLLEIDHPPPTTLIREFFSNLSCHIYDSNTLVRSWIRGVEFTITLRVVAEALGVLVVTEPVYCCEILKYSQVYEPYRSIVGQERGRTHRDLNERRKIN